jgi:hypothetical protein
MSRVCQKKYLDKVQKLKGKIIKKIERGEVGL